MPFRSLDPEASARLSGLRILVAEDEPLVSMEMEDVILEHGAVPIGPFASLTELLKAVEAGGYDVAILDVPSTSASGARRASPPPIVSRPRACPSFSIPATPIAAICSAPIPRRRCARSPAPPSACSKPR